MELNILYWEKKTVITFYMVIQIINAVWQTMKYVMFLYSIIRRVKKVCHLLTELRQFITRKGRRDDIVFGTSFFNIFHRLSYNNAAVFERHELLILLILISFLKICPTSPTLSNGLTFMFKILFQLFCLFAS